MSCWHFSWTIHVVFAVLLVLSCTPSQQQIWPSSHLDLLPNNPAVEVGSTLVLICRIMPSYTGVQNSSAICFRHNNERYCRPPKVVVVDDLTAQLRFTNMSFNNSGHFQCELEGLSFQWRAQQSVTVARKPLVPVIAGCVVWEQVQCSWTPSTQEQRNYTGINPMQQILIWARGTVTGSVIACGRSARDRCLPQYENSVRFELPDTTSAQICVSVVINNVLKVNMTSPLWCEYILNIVQPDRVVDLTYTFGKKTSLIQWQQPPGGHAFDAALVYRVAYFSQWDKEVLKVTVNNTQVLLQTTPYSEYNVSVAVKPAKFGIWSQSIFTSFKTPAAAPSRSPSTFPGAFSISTGTPHVVTLYWQSILAEEHHGSNLTYEVVERPASTDSWTVVETLPSEKSSSRFKLRSIPVELAILSKNEIGAALPSTVFGISSAVLTAEALVSHLIVERNGSDFLVRWHLHTTGNVTNIVLVWCASRSSLHGCEGDINWLMPSLTASNYSLSVHSNLHHIFGLSVNVGTVSSGIRWAKCTHSLTNGASPPEELRVVIPIYGKHGDLLVMWKHQGCRSPDEGYVVAFELVYCQLDSDKHCIANKSVTLPIDAKAYNLTALNVDANYMVWMFSVTRSGRSEVSSKAVFIRTSTSWLTSGVVIAIVIGALVFVVLSVCVIQLCYKSCCRCRRDFTRGVAIVVPDTATKEHLRDTTVDSPDVRYMQSFTPNDNCNGGDIHRPLIPKPAVASMTVPSCRYVNLSHSENQSNVDDAGTAAVHIQLRTDDVDAGATDEPHRTDVSNDNQTALQPAPACCGGYIVVGPDTFGRIDAATGQVTNTDSGVETDCLLRQPRDDGYAGLALATGLDPHNSDLSVMENGHRQAAKAASDGTVRGSVNEMLPSVENVVQGNSSTTDCAPVTDYAMIVGMDDNALDDTERSSSDQNSVGKSQNVARHPDSDLRPEDVLPLGPSVSDEEQHDSPAVPFGISSPPVCYSLNSGGYLSHSELLGAASAV